MASSPNAVVDAAASVPTPVAAAANIENRTRQNEDAVQQQRTFVIDDDTNIIVDRTTDNRDSNRNVYDDSNHSRSGDYGCDMNKVKDCWFNLNFIFRNFQFWPESPVDLIAVAKAKQRVGNG